MLPQKVWVVYAFLPAAMAYWVGCFNLVNRINKRGGKLSYYDTFGILGAIWSKDKTQSYDKKTSNIALYCRISFVVVVGVFLLSAVAVFSSF
jgi:hypothetical protein